MFSRHLGTREIPHLRRKEIVRLKESLKRLGDKLMFAVIRYKRLFKKLTKLRAYGHLNLVNSIRRGLF